MLNDAQAIPRLGSGLVQFKSNTTIAKEKADASQQMQQGEPFAIVDALASYIETCFGQAKRAKMNVEQQMLKNQRQRAGIYEGDKLAAVKAMGGSEVYVLLTATKCLILCDDGWRFNDRQYTSMI